MIWIAIGLKLIAKTECFVHSELDNYRVDYVVDYEFEYDVECEVNY